MLRINQIEMPSMTAYSVQISDVDGESNRNAKGDLVRDRITTKYKLNLEWEYLTPLECSDILNAVEDVFFEVEFVNPKTGGYTTATMYVGDREAPLAFFNDDGELLWKGLKFNLVER